MIRFVCLTGQAVACVQTSPHPLKKIGKRFREPSGSEFTILPNFASHVTPTKIAKRSVT